MVRVLYSDTAPEFPGLREEEPNASSGTLHDNRPPTNELNWTSYLRTESSVTNQESERHTHQSARNGAHDGQPGGSNEDDPTTDFEWVGEMPLDDAYMGFDWNRSPKTCDFGWEGYTASLTDWSDLLQITSPDEKRGVIHVRGRFPDNADSILARAQRFNPKDSWGLKLVKEDGVELDRTRSQGLINLRWPYIHYDLTKNEVDYASCRVFSFVKDGVVYQVARISSISQEDREVPTIATEQKLKFGIGGLIRFGSARTIESKRPVWDKYSLELSESNCLLTCRSKRQEKLLKIRLFVNRVPTPLSFRPLLDCSPKDLNTTDAVPDQKSQEYPHPNVDISSEHEVSFGAKSAVIVLALALEDDPAALQENKNMTQAEIEKPLDSVTAQDLGADTLPGSNTEANVNITTQLMSKNASQLVRDYLGASDESVHAPYRLWKSRLMVDESAFDFFPPNVIGRAVEHIMCVSSVPVTVSIPLRSSRSPSLQKSSIQNQNEADDTQASASDLPLSSPEYPSTEFAAKKSDVLYEMQGEIDQPLLEEARDESLGDKTMADHVGYTPHPQRSIALIQNIMTTHLVDWRSVLSQVRLLVKSYHYFEIQANLKAFPEENTIGQPLAEICKLYGARLLEHIQGVLLWILNKGPHPMTKTEIIAMDPGPLENSEQEAEFYDRTRLWNIESALYPAIIAWYIVRHIPLLFSRPVVKSQFWEKVTHPKWHIFTSIPVKETRSFTFLRWYNFRSMAEIVKLFQMDDPARLEGKTWLVVKVFEDKAKFWKSKSEKNFRLLGKGRSITPPIEYDTVDLVLLAQELWEETFPSNQPSLPISWVRKLVQSRDPTTVFNPGQKLHDKQDTNSAPSTSAPWELSCLNHLSALRVATDDTEIETAEENCRRFLFSDFTFMSSWDHSKPGFLGQWWDISTSCNVASVLLDNIIKSISTTSTILGASLVNSPLERATTTKSREHGTEPKLFLETTLRQNTVTANDHTLDDFARRQLAVSERILSALMRSSEYAEEFDWTTRQPEERYHPETLYFSIDDTPEIFQSEQTKDVDLSNNIQKYFRRKNDGEDINPPDWASANIGKHLKPEDLLYISCVDLAIETSSRADHDVTGQVVVLLQRGRADVKFQTLQFENPARDCIVNEPPRRGYNGKQIPSLWSLYLNGHPEIHPIFKTLPKETQKLFTDVQILNSFRTRYQRTLLAVLTDSLVDLDTKFRLLFAHRTTPTIVQAFVYMLHPNSIDTFDDYFGPVSFFFNTPYGSGDEWITSITISYWGLIRNNEGLTDDFDEARGDKAAFPPKSMSGARRLFHRAFSRTATNVNDVDICLLSSSIVFSGPELGNFWTCSVISSLLIEDDVQYIVSEKVIEIVQMYIHQPSSGRCLVFLLLLGYLCRNLAEECEVFTESLDGIMGMSQTVLLTGIEWQKSEVALRKLKKMLWCLEALRNFDEKLATALSEIKEARKQMLHHLSKSPGQRHKDLSRFADGVIEAFDKRAGRLEDAHSSILQRIDQSTRLREGITSVLGVEQNENIGMLTYITLAYLPLGFIAALFSAGHDVIPDNFGARTFSWLTVIFFVGTFAFALSLQTILGTSHKIYKAIDQQAEAWDRRQMARAKARHAEMEKKRKEGQEGQEEEEKNNGEGRGTRGDRWKAALARRKGKPGVVGTEVDEEARVGIGKTNGQVTGNGIIEDANIVGKRVV